MLRMYNELKAAAEKKEALEAQVTLMQEEVDDEEEEPEPAPAAAAPAAAPVGLSDEQRRKGMEVEARARAALDDPEMPEEAKQQVRLMLAALHQHETELQSASSR